MDSLLAAWEPLADLAPGQRTFEVVRTALLASPELGARNVRVYLHGSRAGDTVTRVDEPVDVVIESGTSYLAGFTPQIEPLPMTVRALSAAIPSATRKSRCEGLSVRGAVASAASTRSKNFSASRRHPRRVTHTCPVKV